jgi:DNA-binding IscR family transcriptional regulator
MRRLQDTAERVCRALVEMTKARTPVSFTSVARQAGVSTDFLYRHL